MPQGNLGPGPHLWLSRRRKEEEEENLVKDDTLYMEKKKCLFLGYLIVQG